MANYAPLITRAIEALPENSGEARRGIYERARNALITQLRSVDPPLEEEQITRERLSLEEAIRSVEAGHAADEAAQAAAQSRGRNLHLPDPLPVSVAGAPVVHEAAQQAEALGAAGEQTLRQAEAARHALELKVGSEPDPTVFEEEAVKPATSSAPPLMPRHQAHVFVAAQAIGPPGASAFETRREEGRGETNLRPMERPSVSFGKKRRRGGVIVPLLLSILVLGGIGGAWLVWQNMRQMPAKPAVVAVEPPAVAERTKNSDRLGATEAQGPQAPASAKPPETAAPPRVDPAPAATTEPVQRPLSPVQGETLKVEKAQLLEESALSQQTETHIGQAVWRTEALSGGSGQTPDLAVRADIDIPQRRMSVTLTIRRNSDATLPASHTIEVLFKLPRDFSNGGVANVPGILAKLNDQSRGQPLVGQSVRVMNGFFFIGLSNAENDKISNIMQMKDRPIFDIPVEYDNRRRAILSIEKGESGQKAIEEALKAWGQM